MNLDATKFSAAVNEIKPSAWLSWCRLCGNADDNSQQSVQTISKQNNAENLKDISSNTILIKAVDKFFNLKIFREDLMPKCICSDCLCIISNTIAFSDHVLIVQNTYTKFIKHDELTASSDLLDLAAARNNIFFNYRKGIVALEHLTKHLEKENEDLKIQLSTAELQDMDAEECVANQVDEEDDDDDAYKIDPFGATALKETNNNVSDKEDSNVEEHFSSSSWDEDETPLQRRKYSKTKTVSRRKNTKHEDITEKDPNFSLELTCKECNYDITSYDIYKEHLKDKHDNFFNKNLHKCLECLSKYKTISRFEKHLRVGHRSKALRYSHKCEQCNESFETENRLERHRKYKHEDDRPYICEECGYRLRRECDLRDHMLSHTDERPFECKDCKLSYKRKSRLQAHILDKHSGLQHKCHICGLVLNSSVTLKQHFLVHSDETPHKCDHCGRCFKRGKSLKEHLIIHTGLKPYSCEFCDSTFANRSSRRSHMKRHHPKEFEAYVAAGCKSRTNIPTIEHLKQVSRITKHVNVTL